MNHREWVSRAVAHEETAVPWNFTFTPPARKKLEGHYGTRHVERTLDFPIRMGGPNTVKPLYAAPEVYGRVIRDEFGVAWSVHAEDRGSPIGTCLPEPDLSRYVFPDPLAPWRYEHLAKWTEEHRERYRVLWVGDLWERATFMRGMEEILLDVALNRGFVEALLRGIADCVLQTTETLLTRFEFEAVALSDDYGTQQGLIISPRDWRLLVKPLLTEIYGLVKRHGRTVFHHTCGNVTEIVGDLIDIGLDILHPIQPETMDIRALKRKFGKRLAFCGGVRTQDLLPTGSPEDVRDEVRRLKEEMGAGGGYILEPGITLQADVPLANLVALIEEARAG
ncbi:MAG TPA: uroporphyrinogen decarboxylase family protein [Candidatus Brocadiia bacterium]|nr:uroporphyrinogen decarboxylase family protein [Candidatus Brocadiia bacterium]